MLFIVEGTGSENHTCLYNLICLYNFPPFVVSCLEGELEKVDYCIHYAFKGFRAGTLGHVGEEIETWFWWENSLSNESRLAKDRN